MSVEYNRMPTYTEPFAAKNGQNSRGWYGFLQAVWKGQPSGPVTVASPTSSPYTYTAPFGGTVVVQGGTVSMITMTRDGLTFYNTGQTQGTIPLSQGDQIVVTYSSVPNITFLPR